MPKICYKRPLEPANTFIRPKIRTLQLLTAVAGQTKRLDIVLGICASLGNWFDVVHRYFRRTTGETARAINGSNFMPFSIREPVAFESNVAQPLISSSENRISQSPSLCIRFFLLSVSEVICSAQASSSHWMLPLPLAQVSCHLSAVRLFIHACLLSAACLALRIVAAFVSLSVKISIRPPTVPLFTSIHQN